MKYSALFPLYLFCCSFVSINGVSAADQPAASPKAGSPKLVTTPLVLRKGGTPEKPAVFDGEGMTIDLGTDVTDHAWKKNGDVWTSTGKLLDREPLLAGDFPGLFLDELTLAIPRDRGAEKKEPEKRGQFYLPPSALAPGQMGYAADGSCYFRWPADKPVGSRRVIMPAKPGVSCVTIACSHIIVRNITARHAGNDGFNIHGAWVGIRIEHVKAFSNSDEGISAHDDVQMDVVDAEVAWNGSSAGGVADVNRCTTSYRDCRIHDNVGAAFHFTGKSHKVSDTLIYNQARDFNIGKETQVERERIEWRK